MGCSTHDVCMPTLTANLRCEYACNGSKRCARICRRWQHTWHVHIYIYALTAHIKCTDSCIEWPTVASSFWPDKKCILSNRCQLFYPCWLYSLHPHATFLLLSFSFCVWLTSPLQTSCKTVTVTVTVPCQCVYSMRMWHVQMCLSWNFNNIVLHEVYMFIYAYILNKYVCMHTYMYTYICMDINVYILICWYICWY